MERLGLSDQATPSSVSSSGILMSAYEAMEDCWRCRGGQLTNQQSPGIKARLGWGGRKGERAKLRCGGRRRRETLLKGLRLAWSRDEKKLDKGSGMSLLLGQVCWRLWYEWASRWKL